MRSALGAMRVGSRFVFAGALSLFCRDPFRVKTVRAASLSFLLPIATSSLHVLQLPHIRKNMAEFQMTEAQNAAANKAFKQHDKKDEGKIRVSDIQGAMSAMGVKCKSDWLEQHEDEIDVSGTGYIHFDEFRALVEKKLKQDADEKELKEIFRVLDKEKKGEVNVNELRWILKSLGDDLTEEEIDDMIADVDTDGSGWVDYEEFSKLMLAE